jgi:hypothetical protein
MQPRSSLPLKSSASRKALLHGNHSKSIQIREENFGAVNYGQTAFMSQRLAKAQGWM